MPKVTRTTPSGASWRAWVTHALNHPDFDDHFEEVGWTLQKYVMGNSHNPYLYSKRHLQRVGAEGIVRTLCGRSPGIVQGNSIGDCLVCFRRASRELDGRDG